MIGCGSVEEAAEQKPVEITLQGLDTLTFNQTSITVPTGAPINLTFENNGTLDHNFLVVQQDTSLITLSDADSFPGSSTGTVAGGATKVHTFFAPFTAGNYIFACSIPGHAASGMSGTFTVTE